MPFGISSAPEVFHRAMEHIIEGIEGAHVYVDDIVLWGFTIEQHNKRLMDVLEQVQKYGLKGQMPVWSQGNNVSRRQAVRRGCRTG